MKPLLLITNDDGLNAKGIQTLIRVARTIGDVVIMAPDRNSSGLAHSFTSSRPLRINTISNVPECTIYTCDGTPVDCIKVCVEHFCPRKPDLVLSGINHGSNASINVLYSGTMGAVIEASASGYQAIGFSLLDHSQDADFEPTVPYIKDIILRTLKHPLPNCTSLNVNFPVPEDGIIRGVKVCRQSHARWLDSYEKRIDPRGMPYFWLTGRFECNDIEPDTDQWALENGFISVVPTTTDFTDKCSMPQIQAVYE
jgi:5'-nucleotidase